MHPQWGRRAMSTMTQLRMLMLGSPGAGKGTLSARVEKKYGVVPISSGDLLRRNISQGTNVGKEAEEQMRGGGFVSDSVMIALIEKQLGDMGRKSWLLDGFPRTLVQAERLDEQLSTSGQDLNLIINLDVPEEVIYDRIVNRLIHPASGRVYNLSYNPPKVPGKDDVTGEELIRRSDDQPDVLAARLEKYHGLTQPVLRHYERANNGRYHSVSGKTSDEIWPQIVNIIGKRFQST